MAALELTSHERWQLLSNIVLDELDHELERGGGRFPFINLQKRLLSSPEAFARTIDVHAGTVDRQGGVQVKASHVQLSLETAPLDPEIYGEDDDAALEEELAQVEKLSRELPTPTEEAQGLLAKMRALAGKARRRPDAKALALFAWLNENLGELRGCFHRSPLNTFRPPVQARCRGVAAPRWDSMTLRDDHDAAMPSNPTRYLLVVNDSRTLRN